MSLEYELTLLEEEYIELEKIYKEKLKELYNVRKYDLEIALIIYELEGKYLEKIKEQLEYKLEKLK